MVDSFTWMARQATGEGRPETPRAIKFKPIKARLFAEPVRRAKASVIKDRLIEIVRQSGGITSKNALAEYSKTGGDYSYSALRMRMQRLADEGRLERVGRGVYIIPGTAYIKQIKQRIYKWDARNAERIVAMTEFIANHGEITTAQLHDVIFSHVTDREDRRIQVTTFYRAKRIRQLFKSAILKRDGRSMTVWTEK